MTSSPLPARAFGALSLAGFAVVSHWLPFLVLSVPVGALNERFDSRRLIQGRAVLFMVASAGWGYFFVTDRLRGQAKQRHKSL